MDSPRFIHASRVTFGDTDCSGWLHFPAIFRHVEEAEHAFYRQIGLPIFDRENGGWPRVHVSCDFRRPLHFGDWIDVRLFLRKVGSSSVEWLFRILTEGGETAAEGRMVTVRVDGRGQPVRIDDSTRAALVGSESA